MNLHPQIVANMEQSDRDGGIYLESVGVGDFVIVQTMSREYTLRLTAAGWTIRGHPVYCEEDTPCVIQGSTWGGSMLKSDFIGIGMHLEAVIEDRRYVSRRMTTITTSPIREVTHVQVSNGE